MNFSLAHNSLCFATVQVFTFSFFKDFQVHELLFQEWKSCTTVTSWAKYSALMILLWGQIEYMLKQNKESQMLRSTYNFFFFFLFSYPFIYSSIYWIISILNSWGVEGEEQFEEAQETVQFNSYWIKWKTTIKEMGNSVAYSWLYIYTT